MVCAKYIKRCLFYQYAVEQIIGREGETATFLSRCLFTFGGLGGGFAPRQLCRWVLSYLMLSNVKSE